MRFFWVSISLIFLMLTSLTRVHAGTGEISLMGGYSKSTYGPNSYSTTRRYSASLGVNFTTTTEIELSYTYTDSFINDQPYQTTSTNEQVLALSLVQTLVPMNWPIQPYVRAGGAQYNKKQTGTVSGIPVPDVTSKSPSAVVGAGIRIIFFRVFSLKAEGVTYLPEHTQVTKNFALQVGLGINF